MIKKIQVTFLHFILLQTILLAGPGDTIKVQTFTFGSPQDAWFEMPGSELNFQKVLMQYKLKCNDASGGAGGLGYACGEWDYLTYTFLYQHTGNLDSTLLFHPNYLANGESPATFNYATEPTYSTNPFWEYSVIYEDTISYNAFQIGTGSDTILLPFAATNKISKTQILWLADELISAGVVSGNISGFQLNIAEAGTVLNHLSVKIKSTDISELNADNYGTAGFTEVFHQNTTCISSAWNHFNFVAPFYWDGISNLLIEITSDNTETGISTSGISSTTDFNSVMHVSSNDKYISFTNPNYAKATENDLDALSQNVTVSFWSFGNPALQPQNGTCFEAVTTSNARVLNSHTPWSDQNIYWDAGNDGGYDRINKLSSAADYENTWTHWAFTKNASTGSMKIYKNGVLWHSGTGKTKLMEGIIDLWIGKGSWGGSSSYEGWMDEFAIWNAELDEATIQSYMNKDLDDAHPFVDQLINYYHFNQDGIYETDISNGENNLAKIGAPTILYKAENQFRNLQFFNTRPNIIFEQGTFISHIDSSLQIEEIENIPITFITFDPLNPTIGLDTSLVWEADYYAYIYDASGNISDSIFVASTNSINHIDLPYYSAPFEIVNRFELARYITPYGIGLDLGDGFTWTFDVTDYLPLLHDSVHLNAGNWQELLDVQFLFIEGTPARRPLDVINLYTGGYGYGYSPSFDEQTVPVTLEIPEYSATSKIKLRITGHGAGTGGCSEFCKKEHFIKVDGVEQWAKDVWRDDCDLNPLYPQGGTWVFDRANWCPGAEVETYDFELTEFVSPGSDVTIDYGAEAYTNSDGSQYPYYVTEVQLVTYGEAAFTNDATLEEILSPSTHQMWQRINPVCNNPVIKIKNTGKENLTSLKIEFGIKDFEKAYYNWEGNLAFMEVEDVVLPNFPWTNSATQFEVILSEPNGVADEYAFNNTGTTTMNLPPTYPNNFIVEFKTNNKPNENDLFLYDALGNTVFERTSFIANTTYRDTLNLSDGCYELVLEDAGEDGLSFWFYPGDGSGTFKLKEVGGSYFKVFEADFGGMIDQQFIVGNYVDIQTNYTIEAGIQIYPNPANQEFFVALDDFINANLSLKIFDINGILIEEKILINNQNQFMQFDASLYASGMYFITVNNQKGSITKKFMIEK